MESTWKPIYIWLETAISHESSWDSLLQNVISHVAQAYNADCCIWTGIHPDPQASLRVFATPKAIKTFASQIQEPPSEIAAPAATAESTQVQSFYPSNPPFWLPQLRQTPQVVQLKTGDLLMPVLAFGAGWGDGQAIASTPALLFVLQLRRHSLSTPVLTELDDIPANPFAAEDLDVMPTDWAATSIQGWSFSELESLEVICSQLALTRTALHCKEQLHNAQQQAALVGRIVHLLNSSLNPDEIVRQIAAELGQKLQCDRCLVVDLRETSISIIAHWDHPERSLKPAEDVQFEAELWQDVVDMFLHGAASHIEVEVSNSAPTDLEIWLQNLGATSVLLVPLFVQEDFFGTVALLSSQAGQSYQLNELQILRQITDQIAIALANAQHYQKLWMKQESLRLQQTVFPVEGTQDHLTQLLNRSALERELEQLSTRAIWAVQTPFSIIICDLDYFKLVNDTHGHGVGDEVLKTVARRFQKQLRRETPAYRYGGEEFAVILNETHLNEAKDVAERLRQVIRINPLKTEAGLVQLTASFGVAQQDPGQDRHAWDVWKRAERALWEAKRQGRDRVEVME